MLVVISQSSFIEIIFNTIIGITEVLAIIGLRVIFNSNYPISTLLSRITYVYYTNHPL